MYRINYLQIRGQRYHSDDRLVPEEVNIFKWANRKRPLCTT
jgi:hypothetical protein